MKHFATKNLLHSALLGVMLLMSACVNTLELAVPNGEQGISHQSAVANAKAYFDIHFGQNTRSNNQTPTEEAPYVVGNIVPDWESGVTVSDNERAYSDFAISKSSRFFLALQDDREELCALELNSRLASVVDFGLDTLNQYIATYIPDIAFLSCYTSYAKDDLLTCEYIDWFTGVVLYSDLSGYHIAAYKYYDGQLVDSSFLYDKQKSQEENIADFMRVMGGVSLIIVPENNDTRAVATVDIPGGTYICCYDELTGKILWEYCNIDTIPIVNTKQTNHNSFIASGGSSNIGFGSVDATVRPLIPTGGGGGGGTTTTEKEELTGEDIAEDLFDTKDLSEEEQKALSKMLEEIYEDCMGKTLIVTMLSKNTKIPIEFNYNTRAGYNYSSGIRLNNTHSESLLHELFHAYQCSQLGYASYNSIVANIEVEAYLATFYYMKRSDNPEVLQRCDNFKRRKLGSRAPLLYEMLDNRAYANPNADLTRFMTIYMIEARVIKSDYDRKHRELGDGKVMGINEEQAFEDSVKNIQSISGECDVNKE